MSKLLRRAKVRFESAKTLYSRINEDDAYLDMCCFDLQQTIAVISLVDEAIQKVPALFEFADSLVEKANTSAL